jgi:hypothetical protein
MTHLEQPASDPTLSCILSLVCPSDTVGGLRAMLATAERLGAGDELELLDGWYLLRSDHDEVPEPGPSFGAPTLGELRGFAASKQHLADDAALADASYLCVDLPVLSIEPAGCAEHVGALPENVYVVVNPACLAES